MNLLEYIRDYSLILIPALLVIGQVIKNIDAIKDKYIPLILLPFGIIGSMALGGFNAENVIQGILVTGAAVYGNQVWKQLQKDE